ncbi:MAG TPA: CvpA family protein [Verrucomicrobiae bacterium]|nr:CvpA family protein [Verrucomicrobiae bacterium]
MTIWILSLLLVAAAVGLGLRQGAIRAAFSFIGIVFAALLATTLGKLFAWLMPHLGIHNQTVIWMLAPIEGFVLILILFKSAAFFVHHKVEMFYKYKAGDLRLSLWERMNGRLGACIGTLNGAAYSVVISFALFNFTYWTTQIAPGPDENWKVRFVNRFGNDLDSTGMSKVAKSVAPLSQNYYKTADLAGLICQNPKVVQRLASYPPFLSLLQDTDLRQLAENSDLANSWKSGAPLGQILNNDTVKGILKNNDLVDLVYGVVETNLDDLTGYLKTGQSAKYDSEKILGRWDFNVGVSLAMVRQMRPNIPPREYAVTRILWNSNYANTVFIAGSDGKAFLNKWPTFKNPPNQTPSTVDFKGNWEENGGNYTIQVSANGENKSYRATTDGLRLTVSEGKNVYIFDHE